GATEPDDERSRTGLCHVALARRRPAHRAPVAGQMLAAGARAVAGIGGAGVAGVRAGGARVARRVPARGARAAALVQGAGVAVVSAGRARIARGVLAGVVRAVALVEGARVAVGGAGRPTRLLDVGGAGGARARAGVSEVTLRRRRAAHRT